MTTKILRQTTFITSTIMALLAIILLYPQMSIVCFAKGGEDTVIKLYENYRYDEDNDLHYDKEYTINSNPRCMETISAPNGISYDVATSTLTLNNYNNPGAFLEINFEESIFNLKVVGNNEILGINLYSGSRLRNHVFNITGDGTLVIDRNRAKSIYGIFYDSYSGNSIHVDKYVNLTIYPGREVDYDTGENGDDVMSYTDMDVIVIRSSTVSDKTKAVSIEGDIKGNINIESTVPYNEHKVINAAYIIDENASLPVYRQINTDNYYAVQPYLDNEGNELCNLYSIEIGKNHTFLRKYDYIIVSAENLNKWYEPCTSRPDEFASFVKTSSVNGTLYIEGIAVAASEDGFWCYSKDGKYYGRDIEPSSMIGFYDFSNAYIYDEDWGGVYKTKDELYDLEPYEKVAYGDSYVEFNQNIKNTGYTEVVSFVTTDYNVKANPLTITAKEKPSATISCSADGFTKAVGDAAFSIGAKTNAEKLTYVSDNNQVATVSGSGIVTVVGAGTANITVTASGSEYKTATKIIKITVEAAKVGYSVKDKSGATYKVTNVDANDIEVEYKPSSKASKKVSIPSNITVNGIKANVTSISQNAFSNNKKVTEVVIPKTVVKIEKNAFKNCKKLKKITISENVTTIGAEAFTGDKKLKTIIIKSSKITKTGSKAFKNVPRTAKITVPKKMKKKYRSMFKKAGFKGTVK